MSTDPLHLASMSATASQPQLSPSQPSHKPQQLSQPSQMSQLSQLSQQSQLKRKRAAGATLPPSPTALHDTVLTIELPASKRRRECEDVYDGKFGCVNDNTAYIASPPSSPSAPSSPTSASLSLTDSQSRSDSVSSLPPSVSTPSVPSAPSASSASPSATAATPSAIERVKDIVQYQFGYEILLKHNELRLIEQEMAKCQVALEQLRRCHLIPYPTACPTPEQMLDIASGRGAAVRPRPGAATPKWAAPFGVVDGPYARHYAKWLIPDPVFDGPLPNWPGLAPAVPSGRSKSAATAEARAMRNHLHTHSHTFSDVGLTSGRGRPTRGLAGQKLHALSNGYPQPKDKAGPCVLRRGDGKVVKLVCIDCHRENFSSTQGFINHCRIAHKRDFKSHEEAAVHCGHPVDVDVPVPSTKKSNAAGAQAAPAVKPTSTPAGAAPAAPAAPATGAAGATAFVASVHSATATSTSTPVSTTLFGSGASSLASSAAAIPGHVYPLARKDEAVDSLLQHIDDTFQKSVSVPAGAAAKPENPKNPKKDKDSSQAPFVGSDKTPALSRFMQERNLGGNLKACVDDAKEVMDLDDYDTWAPDASEDCSSSTALAADAESTSMSVPAAPTAAKRMPARQAPASTSTCASFVGSLEGADGADSSTDHAALSRSSSKSVVSQVSDVTFDGSAVCTLEFAKKEEVGENGVTETRLFLDDDEMDVDLIPNTITSNNAPSLVSDDGEYDDSDDGSASDTSDTDLESLSDVAEINVAEDEDQTHGPTQPLHHHRTSTGSAAAMKLKKEDAKHVSFVNPVTGSDNAKPKHQQH